MYGAGFPVPGRRCDRLERRFPRNDDRCGRPWPRAPWPPCFLSDISGLVRIAEYEQRPGRYEARRAPPFGFVSPSVRRGLERRRGPHAALFRTPASATEAREGRTRAQRGPVGDAIVVLGFVGGLIVQRPTTMAGRGRSSVMGKSAGGISTTSARRVCLRGPALCS